MSTRMTFAGVPIGQCFTFLGNPIVWRKLTNFEYVSVSNPYSSEELTHSFIDSHDGTLSLVDVHPDFDDLNPISSEK